MENTVSHEVTDTYKTLRDKERREREGEEEGVCLYHIRRK